MYKKSLLPLFIFVSLAIGFILGKLLYQSDNYFYSQNKDFLKLKNVIELIENNYKDEIDVFDFLRESLLKKLTEIDPYSYYLDNTNYKELQLDNEGIFYGLGISYVSYNDTIIVLKVYENSPAQLAGIKPLDQILKIDDIVLSGVIQDSVAQIFSDRSKFVLTVKKFSNDNIELIKLKKDEIELKSVFYKKLNEKTGLIKITRFSENTYKFFNEAAKKFKSDGLNYMILDLRDNPGGILSTSVDILEEFFSENDTLVITETNKGTKQYYIAQKKGLLSDVNLIVLINENSASASELVSVALQDNDRALFIGSKSYGKGVFQQNLQTVQNDFLHITTGKFYGPSGRWIDNTDLFAEYDFRYFKTKHGRYVISRNGIIPEIYASYYNPQKLLDLMEFYIIDLIFKNKNSFRNIDLAGINQISKSIADTSQIFSSKTESIYILNLGFSKFLSSEEDFQNAIIFYDSLYLKALEIIEDGKIEENIFFADTVQIKVP